MAVRGRDGPDGHGFGTVTLAFTSDAHLASVVTRHRRPPDDAPTVSGAELPDLEPGLTLLEFDDGLASALQALVVDHLLRTDGRARWIDAGGRARTTTLRELAPSRRLLNRVRIARAFTAFQHATLVGTVDDRLRAADAAPAVVVCPAVDLLARTGDLDGHERDELLLSTVATLARVARAHDCPVLVTRTPEVPGRVDGALERAADRTLACEATRFGPRFAGDGTETLVYAADADGWRQTTIAYWARILAARADAADAAPTPEVTARGAN